jgi:hypothetical protein
LDLTVRLLAGLLLTALASAPTLASPSRTQWAGGGLPVASKPVLETNALIVSDGSGGAVIAWSRPDTGGIYAVGLDADGNVKPGWVPGGRLVHGGSDPDMVPDGAGGAYIASRSFGAIAIQHFGPLGSAPGSAIEVPVPDSGPRPSRRDDAFQIEHNGFVLPVVALDGQGGMFVAFTDDERFYDDAFIRHYDSGGSSSLVQLQAKPSCSPYICYGDYTPTACPDGAGGVFVAWSVSCGARVLRLNAALSVAPGWPDSGITVEPCRAYTPFVGICSDQAGGAYVAWQGYPNGPSDLRIQRVTGVGTLAAGWPVEGLVISPYPTLPGTSRSHYGDFCSIAADGQGGALVTWTDQRADSGDVYVTRVTPGGTVASGWPSHGVGVGVAAGFQQKPVVVSDGGGGAVVAWQDDHNYPDGAIYTNHVGADGALAPPGVPGGVLVSAGPGWREVPRLAGDGAGGAIIAWTDYRAGNGDIYAARVLADGTVGTLVDLVSAAADDEGVRLEWRLSPEAGASAWIERRDVDSEFAPLARVTPDGSQRIVYVDRDVAPGGRYGYRLSIDGPNGLVETDPVWVTAAMRPVLALTSVRPNPSSDGFMVVFDLPGSGDARLELVDAAGRVCIRQEVGSMGAGHHEVMLGSHPALAAGVYFLRLERAGDVQARRVSVIR